MLASAFSGGFCHQVEKIPVRGGDLLGEALSSFDDGVIGGVAFLGGQSIEERIRAARAIGLG
jgi:hypothetical protein